jgi:glycosyltransferase 2 family protein
LNTGEGPKKPKLFQTIQRWRAKLSPIAAIIIIGIFIYWAWKYRGIIASTFEILGILHLTLLVLLIGVSLILSVFTFTILVRDKGYTFSFSDGYHSLNLSQLASMVPGKIWGFAGLAGLLWSKGISKLDSVAIILLNTLIMLSACAIVGFTGIGAVAGWEYSIISILPFVFLILGRDHLEKIRHKYSPLSSPLPSTRALLKVLLLGVVVWLIVSSSFTWFIYLSQGGQVVPFWIATGAYAASYLGGFISLLAPSGLGVSEGLVALILGPYLGAEKVIAIAISFRIVHTCVIWFNILLTLILNSIEAKRKKIDLEDRSSS